MTDLVTTDQGIEATPVSAPARGTGSAWLMWFARRMGLAVLTLWLCSVLVFFATAALGDPVRAILGKDYATSPERVAALEAQLHLDQPVITRYFEWLGGCSRATSATRSPTASRSVTWSATGSSTPRCW